MASFPFFFSLLLYLCLTCHGGNREKSRTISPKIKDPTGEKHDEAKKYIDVYKNSFRPTPRIKNKKFGEFTLSGPDEKFVADMVNKKGRFKEGNNE